MMAKIFTVHTVSTTTLGNTHTLSESLPAHPQVATSNEDPTSTVPVSVKERVLWMEAVWKTKDWFGPDLISYLRPMVRRLCQEATNWETISYMYQMHLLDMVPVCASMNDVLWSETRIVGFVPSLLLLYDYGAITLESSPGTLGDLEPKYYGESTQGNESDMDDNNSSGGDDNDGKTDKNESSDDEIEPWDIVLERPHVIFLFPQNSTKIPASKLEALKRIVREHPDLNARINPVYHHDPNTKEQPLQQTSVVINGKTREQALQRLDSGKWQEHSANSHDGSTKDLLKFPAIKEANPLQFQIAANHWREKKNLQDIIVKCMESAGLEPFLKGLVGEHGTG